MRQQISKNVFLDQGYIGALKEIITNDKDFPLSMEYDGLPFVGIQETVCKSSPRPIRTYCLFIPLTEHKLGGIHCFPMDPDPEYPWLGGIKGLAATIVEEFGPGYVDLVTFNPPEPSKIPSCTITYEMLNGAELELLTMAAAECARRRV